MVGARMNTSRPLRPAISSICPGRLQGDEAAPRPPALARSGRTWLFSISMVGLCLPCRFWPNGRKPPVNGALCAVGKPPHTQIVIALKQGTASHPGGGKYLYRITDRENQHVVVWTRNPTDWAVRSIGSLSLPVPNTAVSIPRSCNLRSPVSKSARANPRRWKSGCVATGSVNPSRRPVRSFSS